ncbi:hypothetical protein U729_3274 (plasmid) [Clostridium baratii str. Sullivan]|uniref:Uncharacterized protein n=1 Tax=Clostridium baratii str. Sullivan TaxID=1415775 RepID=A0A0A7G075_9CLOT|nr:hypothetical protein [Clostridium baratii]AIY85253.1 hypothetical protein U729_3274 [Clostridium baratii str. Sullivan]
MNHLLIAERVKAEEEIKKQKHLNSLMKNKIKSEKESIYDIVGEQRAILNPEVIGDSTYTYDKLKSKIIYNKGGDKYLTRGKNLIVR